MKVYTNETCPYCKAVKEHLEQNNVEFEELLTNENEQSYNEIVYATNSPTVPTIVLGDRYLVPGRDFNNPSHLLQVIKNYKETNISIEKLNLERTKTLNYNMHVAFSRVDQILRKIENKLNTLENDRQQKQND
tara:strand:- start:85 stop:483 length:399 start_codon:yes stop_codon:yes gene_type:complete